MCCPRRLPIFFFQDVRAKFPALPVSELIAALKAKNKPTIEIFLIRQISLAFWAIPEPDHGITSLMCDYYSVALLKNMRKCSHNLISLHLQKAQGRLALLCDRCKNHILQKLKEACLNSSIL